MTLSAPIFKLKREARLLARERGMPLHAALDEIARREGYTSWSLLAARQAKTDLAAELLADLAPADMLLVGARPRQGKTRLSLALLIAAMRAGRPGALFSLEYSRAEVDTLFAKLGEHPQDFAASFLFDNSDEINADHIMSRLADTPSGAVVVIDYLQALDQKRTHPPLQAQVEALKAFAQQRGLSLVFIAQIHRSYDPSTTPQPGLQHVRLPNPLALDLFSKACFLNNGQAHVEALA